MLAFVIIVLVVYAALAGHAFLLALGAAGLYAAWYGWSITRRPYRPCWACGGKGESTGVDPGNDGEHKRTPFGRCRVCQGSKRQVRWGVRVFRPGTYAQIKGGVKGRYH